jgi:hypothetical protein
MTGVALLMATAVLGVDYGWQPTTDGQLEYIIQMEPVTLVALRGGQELISQVDPYVQGVRRFRIRVGAEMVPRRGTPPRQTSPPRGLPVPPGVQYGWRGINNQQMEFIIQLSHERLVLMRGGEELVGEIPAEVQNVTQWRIRSGVEPPPRQGLHVAAANLPAENVVPAESAGEMTPAASSVPTFPPQQPGPAAPAAAEPTVASPPRMEPDQPTLSNPRPLADTGDEPRPPPAPGRIQGEGAWQGTPDEMPEPPVAPTPFPRADNAVPQAPTGGNWQIGPIPSASEEPPPSPLAGPAPTVQPGQWDRAPINGGTRQNPASPPVFEGSIDGETRPAVPSEAPPASQPVVPSTVPMPYTPQWSSGEQPPPTTAIVQTPRGPTFGSSSSRPIDMTVSAPRLPWERRIFDSDREIRSTRPQPDFWASLAATAQDPTLAYLHGQGLNNASEDRPWGPLALALMVLFVSLGANLYMGWIAVDMYQRYLELADDLTERDSTSRSSLDDFPVDEDDDWDDLPRRRSRVATLA